MYEHLTYEECMELALRSIAEAEQILESIKGKAHSPYNEINKPNGK